MAEECISLLGTSEITEPDEGNSRRHSTGEPISLESEETILPHYRRASIGLSHDRNNSRRKSTGKLCSPNNGHNILPRYLRASTGSCHDLCKYGRKHAFEVQARPPIPKRITSTASEMQNPMRMVVTVERKRTTVAKLKPSPLLKTHSPDPPEIIKWEVSVPPKKVEVSSKQDLSNDKKTTKNEQKMDLSAKRVPSAKPKPAAVKPSSSSDTSAGINGRQNRNIGNGKNTGTSKAPVKKVLEPPTAQLSPNPPVSRIVSLNARRNRSLKLVSPLKDQNKIWKAKTKQPNNDKVQEKTLHVIETENEDKIMESIQNGGVTQLPSSPPPVKLPESSSNPNSPSLSSHEEEDREESECSDSETDDFISENDDAISMNEVQTSEGNHNRTRREGEVVLPDHRDCTPVNLKFRRGKVVDLRSENNGPRRLRFRRGRVLGGNQDSKGDTRRRSFKKRGVDDINSTKSNSEKVVLRHQDMQGKKDGQGLFNNVIEETASKLAESRKSKVKALVGAFETVISLQENKPSSPMFA